MKLEPDLELLERIGILSNPFIPYIHKRGYQMEVEDQVFESFKPFLIQHGGENALHELFFYQLNFINPLSENVLKLFQDEKEAFESRIKLGKLNFSQLESIKLTFKNNQGKRTNAPLPTDLVKLIGQVIKRELESEKPKDVTPEEKLKETKERESIYTTTRKKIQEHAKRIDSILSFKPSPNKEPNSILCSYALLYQMGFRLKFKRNLEELEENISDSEFYSIIEDTTNPIENKSFAVKRVFENASRE